MTRNYIVTIVLEVYLHILEIVGGILFPLPPFLSFSATFTLCPHVLLFIFIRCCYISMDSVTPALWNGACSKQWISEQMRKKILMFNNCFITNLYCYEKTALFYTFRSKETHCDSTNVTEQYLANCPKLLKLRLFNPPSTKLSNRPKEKLTVKSRQSSQNRWDGNNTVFS